MQYRRQAWNDFQKTEITNSETDVMNHRRIMRAPPRLARKVEVLALLARGRHSTASDSLAFVLSKERGRLEIDSHTFH